MRNYLVSFGWFMVFKATFNNISVNISWQKEKNNALSQVTDKLYHIMCYRVQLVIDGVQTCNFSVDRH